MDSVPLYAIINVTVAALVLIIGGTTVCVVRCFRPEGTKGPKWFRDRYGSEQIVKGPLPKKSWLERVPAAAA